MENQEYHNDQGHNNQENMERPAEKREPRPAAPRRPKKSPVKRIIKIVISAIILIIVIMSLYGLFFGDDKANGQGDEKIAREAVQLVGQHMLLPNEEPLVATITDADSLRAEQAFYANVSDGDYLLIYASSQQAILYNPRHDIIVNVGPLLVGEGQ